MKNAVVDTFLRRREKQLEEERAKWLYRVTAGFTDPEPPTPEQIQAMEEGIIEL